MKSSAGKTRTEEVSVRSQTIVVHIATSKLAYVMNVVVGVIQALHSCVGRTVRVDGVMQEFHAGWTPTFTAKDAVAQFSQDGAVVIVEEVITMMVAPVVVTSRAT